MYGMLIIHSNFLHESDPPEHLRINLVDANSTHLTFSILSQVNPKCSDINYHIEASSNCGSCPDITNLTTIVCFNFTEAEVCNLTVDGVICGNIRGNRASFLVNLRGRTIIVLLCMLSQLSYMSHNIQQFESPQLL